MRIFRFLLAFSLISSLTSQATQAAPGSFIASKTNLQANDLYVFKSYETGRENFITFIANFGQQDSTGFIDSILDPNANYEINIDTDGDGIENQTYRFEFLSEINEGLDLVTVGDKELTGPFLSSGGIFAGASNAFVSKTYQIELIRKTTAYETPKNGPSVINTGKQLRLADETAEKKTIFSYARKFHWNKKLH